MTLITLVALEGTVFLIQLIAGVTPQVHAYPKYGDVMVLGTVQIVVMSRIVVSFKVPRYSNYKNIVATMP